MTDLLSPDTLVILDIETTGLSPDHDRILSISASYRSEEFHSFVNPIKKIPADATRINGISQEMVASAPTWDIVSKQFFTWIFENAGPNPVLCAYNGARFDLPFIIKQTQKVDTSTFPKFESAHHCDPFEIAQAHVSRAAAGNHRQASVYKWLFKEEAEDQHSSAGDIKALRRIVESSMFGPRLGEYTKRLKTVY